MVGIFGNGGTSAAGVPINEDNALGVPAIWAAIGAISGTIASLPLHLFAGKDDKSQRLADTDPLYSIIHDRWNPELTSYAGLKYVIGRLLLRGRAVVFIEKNKAGRVMNLWPLDTDKVIVERRDGKLRYRYQTGGKEVIYASNEVLDLVLFPAADGISHRDPLQVNRNAIGLMIAAESYASTLFMNGGVPPLALNGPAMSVGAAGRASNQIQEALRSAKNENRNVLVTPEGYKLEAIGFDPMKQQLLELRRFQVTEASRIFNVPPSMLQDLSTGTYSNVEQQDLNYVKHTISPLLEMIEQEMNAKLISTRNTNFIEFALDGLLRADFKSRMEGMAHAIHAALITPNEARALENREPLEGGDELYIQAATVPLKQAGENLIKDAEPATKGVPVTGDPLADPLPPEEQLPPDRVDDATPTDSTNDGGATK